MRGLTVRWSLAEAAPAAGDELARHVAESSFARCTGMTGLRFTTWRVRPGEWFESSYVFVDEAARSAFETELTGSVAESPVSRIVGSGPVLVEPCDVVAVAEGWEGFEATPGRGATGA
ncbi:hypothetical protein [Nocardioides solisilvae]|uniref:hypothetical protein n=1 Tax=Nocardioides solisilvae TaxID=1542435 RepID=UPI000D7423EC|nr:hypothetical protein [Nocardioides solisilvae]